MKNNISKRNLFLLICILSLPIGYYSQSLSDFEEYDRSTITNRFHKTDNITFLCTWIGEELGISYKIPLAIMNHESNYGNSRLAKEQCNYFGLMHSDGSAMSFDSRAQCFVYFKGVLERVYKKCIKIEDPDKIIDCIAGDGAYPSYAQDKDWKKLVTKHLNKIP